MKLRPQRISRIVQPSSNGFEGIAIVIELAICVLTRLLYPWVDNSEDIRNLACRRASTSIVCSAG